MSTIDTVQIATRRYNELHARQHRGETILAAEWTACAVDLKAAAATFTDDRYNFCNDRAKDCEYQASHAARIYPASR